MSTARTLSYRNDLCELSRMAEDLCAYCREHGIDPDTTLALTLCMNELFANSVQHGYGKGKNEPSAGGADSVSGKECTRQADAGYSAAHAKGAEETKAEAEETARTLYPVEIVLQYFDNRLEARYSDSAKAFNPFASEVAPLPSVDVPPEELPTGGFGLHLLRKMSSARGYERVGGRNRVFLSFVWR